MECRKLVITVVSANNLPDVRNLFRMKVYAKVSIEGSESKTTQETPVDLQGETDPRWNVQIEYTVSESVVQKPGVNLSIKLFCERSLGDRFIGEVNIPVKGLFDMGLKAEKIMSYDVSGTPSGRLQILYSFGEKIWVEKPRGWRKAAGALFLELVEEAFVLLSGESNDGDGGDGVDVGEGSNDHDDDEEIFFDA
ncbi:hypothetical protein CDL12_14394 [Handroanthus impetiginosus]|uniref:C2 domain-containing protein n=1 Tax=Handroanthus impetiginosus TaxID=429701 RepID=A0A2G9H694_9LAMI|nr:hypothetical protein CDL12_14394 [Handroanthus impetiginosus]